MYNPMLGDFDDTADMMEYGLMAFASPEFIERFVQQLAQAPGTDSSSHDIEKGQPRSVAA
jgi:hypothetical protein